MKQEELDKWWANLTIAQKERVGSKIAKSEVHYPECTKFWDELTDKRKKAIFLHCSNKHGEIQKEYQEGLQFSY